MTIPAPAGVAQHLPVQDTLPLSSPPAPVAARLIATALDRDLSPKAFRLYAVVLLRMPVHAWHTTATMGAAAGVSDHTVRPLVAELVRAGLVRQEKYIVSNDRGVSSVRSRYTVVVPA